MFDDIISESKVITKEDLHFLVRPTIPKGTAFEVVRCNPFFEGDDCLEVYNEVYGRKHLLSGNFEVVK